jgi:hypothetical protein
MEKIITALHEAGIAAPYIFALGLAWLVLKYGPLWIKTISDCILSHRRFASQRHLGNQAVKLAWANRQQLELSLEHTKVVVSGPIGAPDPDHEAFRLENQKDSTT